MRSAERRVRRLGRSVLRPRLPRHRYLPSNRRRQQARRRRITRPLRVMRRTHLVSITLHWNAIIPDSFTSRTPAPSYVSTDRREPISSMTRELQCWQILSLFRRFRFPRYRVQPISSLVFVEAAFQRTFAFLWATGTLGGRSSSWIFSAPVGRRCHGYAISTPSSTTFW